MLASCADSLKYAIDYMEKGIPPGNRRGITRLAGAQREISVDPKSIYFIKAAALERTTVDNLTEDQKDLLNDLLAIMTKKERKAFEKVRGSGYSFGEAAVLMGVSKGTTQTLVARAEEKLGFVIRKPPIDEGVFSVKLMRPVSFVWKIDALAIGQYEAGKKKSSV